MSWHLAPAAFSLMINVFVIFLAQKHLNPSRPFIYLVLALCIQNICELLLFTNFHEVFIPDVTLRAYYAATMLVLMLTINYVADVIDIQITKNLLPFLWILGVSIILLIVFTNAIIAGYAPSLNTMPRVTGVFYWLFQSFAIFVLIFGITLPILGYQLTQIPRTQIRCLYVFISILAPVITGFFVIIAASLDTDVNANIMLPIATTIFVLLSCKTESKRPLVDLRRLLPMSEENQASSDIKRVLDRYAQGERSHTSSMDEIERSLIIYKYTKSGNNASKTARSMGIPRATLYSKFRRLNIDHSHTDDI